MLIATSCLLTLSLASISAFADSQSTDEQVLYSYEGNVTDISILPVDLVSYIGKPAFFIAEAVKFKAPKANWKVDSVQLYAWDGYDGSNESIPSERIISLEIRDKDLNLLYKFADSQIPYTNYARNATGIYPLTIEIPQISVSGDFYICFYDRGAIAIASEPLNKTSENSFLYVDGSLLNSTLPTAETTVTPVNWIMKVTGR
jgi:hypothetical protein